MKKSILIAVVSIAGLSACTKKDSYHKSFSKILAELIQNTFSIIPVAEELILPGHLELTRQQTQEQVFSCLRSIRRIQREQGGDQKSLRMSLPILAPMRLALRFLMSGKFNRM